MLSIDITFRTETSVPYNYQYELYSAIQSKMKTVSPETTQRVHSSRGIPLFNSSALLPLGFTGPAQWVNARTFMFMINTIYQEVADVIGKALQPGTSLRLNSCVLNVLSIKTREVDFKFVPVLPQLKSRGPIVIKEKEKYYMVGEREFEVHLLSVLKRKADAVTGRNTVARGLTVTTSHPKVYIVSGHKVPASILSFILDADEDVIRTALVYGVGAKTQMGFGMVAVGEQ